jgi:uncharacterized membrane protein YkvI
VLLAGILLYVTHQNKISNYQELLKKVLGSKIAGIIDFLLSIFLFLGVGIMLSASGAVFYEHLYLPKYLGIFIGFMAVLIALWTGKNGLVASYNILVPVKIILLLLVNMYTAICINNDAIVYYTNSGSYWVIAAILYVAYNFTLAIVVLTEYRQIASRKDGISGAMLGGLVLGLLLLLNIRALANGIPEVFSYEVPMLFIAAKISISVKYIYLMVLWLGIITTAIANTYGFTQRAAKSAGLSFKVMLVLTLTAAVPISFLSFSDLVGMIYPLFGIIGIIIITALIYQYFKDIAF